ncbi:hypothetical protein BYT27DRAFT_7241230 [Phlegmacium glaucopus]|nr:hypothetical protein BYT27DRAFT_7241230 [Phlegmacium glaucopus]
MIPVLPNDIILVIFGHLHIEDIFNARQACWDFYELTKSRRLWDQLVYEHVLRHNIPIPGLAGRNIDSLEAQELERGLLEALKLRRNWRSQSPAVVRQTNMLSMPNSRVVALYFMTELGDRWLVSLSMLRDRRFVIQCWDLHVSPPNCRAQRELRHFRGMEVNRGVSTVGSVVILNPQLEVMSLDLTARDSGHGFNTVKFQIEIKKIHAFSGSLLLASDGTGRLHLWDIKIPQSKVELRNSEQTILDVILDEKMALITGINKLELFALPSSFPLSNDTRNIVLNPVSSFEWPWRIDDAAMTKRIQLSKPHDVYNSVGILLRFRSLFPWSMNLLHQYELHTNKFYTSSSPLSEINSPYQFPPILSETIGSPVRLHATSDMAFGPYGTAIWTDSHTEDYFCHADRGQRLAGTFLLARNVQDGEDEEVELSDQIANAAATSVYSFQEEDSWVRLALDEAEGRIILGHDDGRISVLEYI